MGLFLKPPEQEQSVGHISALEHQDGSWRGRDRAWMYSRVPCSSESPGLEGRGSGFHRQDWSSERAPRQREQSRSGVCALLRCTEASSGRTAAGRRRAGGAGGSCGPRNERIVNQAHKSLGQGRIGSQTDGSGFQGSPSEDEAGKAEGVAQHPHCRCGPRKIKHLVGFLRI